MSDMSIVDFYEEYVSNFLTLINFHQDDDFFEDWNERQDAVFSVIERRYSKDPEQYEEMHNKYSKEFSGELFDYVKNHIAINYPEFFKSRIGILNRIIGSNPNYVSQSGMKVSNSLTFEDYYNNYLIAIEQLAVIDSTDK